MILVVPIILYFVIVVALLFLSNKLSKSREVEERIRNRKRIIITSLVLFPILGLLYFSFLWRISLSDHVDVKRGTFLWHITMDNKTINEFPIIHPLGNPTYNKIGGDSPTISTGWGIEYISKKRVETLKNIAGKYLKKEGFNLSEVSETKFYWTGRFKANENTHLLSGSNKKGEGLDLLLQKQADGSTRIECTLVY